MVVWACLHCSGLMFSRCFRYICKHSLDRGHWAWVQGFEGWWVSRSVAREQVHKVIGDTGMMDYMLKAIANRTVGPWAVFRLP